MKRIFDLDIEYKASLGVALVSLWAIIFGILIPHTTTVWFWSGMFGLFGIATLIGIIKNSKK